MLVGEQPGDREDIEGQPLRGAAGRVLDHGLERAGIARGDAYITNVVKHFRYKARGQRRIHQRPDRCQVAACLPWLETDIGGSSPRRSCALARRRRRPCSARMCASRVTAVARCSPAAPNWSRSQRTRRRSCVEQAEREAAMSAFRVRSERRREMAEREVVAVTGPRAGWGGAIAREFARHGAAIGLIARGRAALAAAKDVAELGGVPSVTHRGRRRVRSGRGRGGRDRAAPRSDRRLDQQRDDDRVRFLRRHLAGRVRAGNGVTYLGAVWGTKAALERMLPRDGGTVVTAGWQPTSAHVGPFDEDGDRVPIRQRVVARRHPDGPDVVVGELRHLRRHTRCRGVPAERPRHEDGLEWFVG